MTTIDQILLKDLQVVENHANVAVGALMIIMQDGMPCIVMRASTDGRKGSATPGFVSFEGQHLGIFQSDYNLLSTPAILAGKLIQIIVRQPQPSATSLHPVKVGDVCQLSDYTDACLAIAPGAGREANGFLLMAGESAGEIVQGYYPHIRIGRIGVARVTP